MNILSQKILNALEFTSGCTEPAAIAFAAAWVGSVSPGTPDTLFIGRKNRFFRKKNETDDSFLSFDDDDYNWQNWENMIEVAVQDETLRKTLEKGIRCNAEAARYGKTHLDGDRDDLVSGAIFSRMTGDPIMVMSCAGSGNKGLTSIVPVLAVAERENADPEKRLKAVTLSALVTSLVTARFVAVSSTCGVLYAAGAGLVSAFLYLENRLKLFPAAYRNYISAVAGAFCDGAKGSCAMRGSSAVQNALKAVQFTKQGFQMKDTDGFLGHSFRETLDNLLRYNSAVSEFDIHTIQILQGKSKLKRGY